mmetsp:Transcript_3136/g.5532  ORF Transcript_3136/g.5532 Transcript_3136/m.5532 type:complete len:155 (+) Transcript_3136:129-593(+)|eukprot:CAMPEP_0196659342 /NCGR_PEP_ID=MMETSP1086-20130531/34456_1 /TAXON_ID=77921 /ORGANISM="Cyanoptyche  gloeocystis , Strain SAG4.97" /LENGTH=154 /DNA_ID=CAMNT_0041993283 /DNA_START=126 /DNA_END=590 /DNA_ORIENTATION=+
MYFLQRAGLAHSLVAAHLRSKAGILCFVHGSSKDDAKRKGEILVDKVKEGGETVAKRVAEHALKASEHVQEGHFGQGFAEGVAMAGDVATETLKAAGEMAGIISSQGQRVSRARGRSQDHEASSDSAHEDSGTHHKVKAHVSFQGKDTERDKVS